MLYARPPHESRLKEDKYKLKVAKEPEEFICAIRYGVDATKEKIFEAYTAIVTKDVPCAEVMFTEKIVYDLKSDKLSNGKISSTKMPLFKKSIVEMNELIVRDALINKSCSCNVMWWIDIAMEKVSSDRIDKYVEALGLPSDSKFRSNYSQFGVCLSKSEKSHMYAGNGVTSLGGVSSLTFFIQSIWISRVPVVHNMPKWLDNLIESCFSKTMKDSMKKYYYSRFAFLFQASNETSLDEDYCNAYESADAIASVSCLCIIQFYFLYIKISYFSN